jgi:hypothetical protein
MKSRSAIAQARKMSTVRCRKQQTSKEEFSEKTKKKENPKR